MISLFLWLVSMNYSGDAGMVDSYISGKIVQLKEQIATLEKREERWCLNLFWSWTVFSCFWSWTVFSCDFEPSEYIHETDTRRCLLIESRCSEGLAVNFLVTRYHIKIHCMFLLVMWNPTGIKLPINLYSEGEHNGHLTHFNLVLNFLGSPI